MKDAVNHKARGKDPRPDNILIDTTKDGNNVIKKELVKLSSACLKRGKVQQQWKDANMIILPRKGDKKDINNYRPISLLSNIYKLFSKVVINSLESVLDSNQPKEQAGFKNVSQPSTTSILYTS